MKQGEQLQPHHPAHWALPCMLLLLMCLCIYSVTNGEKMSSVVADLCNKAPLLCVPEGFYDDTIYLADAGYQSYSIGFEALRRVGPFLFVLHVAALGVVAWTAGAIVPENSGKKLVLGWSTTVLFFS